MTRNQLPEGVGKKIVEALKRQAEADITPVEQFNGNISMPVEDVKETQEINRFEPVQEPAIHVSNNTEIVEEENTSSLIFEVPEKKDEVVQNQLNEPVLNNNVLKSTEEPAVIFNKPVAKPQTYSGIPLSEEPQASTAAHSVSVNIPNNVAVLKNLIASLPVGVTKQTGAQIIRQTIEAMGLPMSGVLKEAQEVQEELNANTRECMLRIQEYKTNILQLEHSVQEYQKNITQINDLVSLFLLTDRK